MAIAVEVSTRLWLDGVISSQRNRSLVWELTKHVRAVTCLCSGCLGDGLLVCVDGYRAYIKAVHHAFAVPLHTGRRGRPKLFTPQGLMLGQTWSTSQIVALAPA